MEEGARAVSRVRDLMRDSRGRKCPFGRGCVTTSVDSPRGSWGWAFGLSLHVTLLFEEAEQVLHVGHALVILISNNLISNLI